MKSQNFRNRSHGIAESEHKSEGKAAGSEDRLSTGWFTVTGQRPAKIFSRYALDALCNMWADFMGEAQRFPCTFGAVVSIIDAVCDQTTKSVRVGTKTTASSSSTFADLLELNIESEGDPISLGKLDSSLRGDFVSKEARPTEGAVCGGTPECGQKGKLYGAAIRVANQFCVIVKSEGGDTIALVMWGEEAQSSDGGGCPAGKCGVFLRVSGKQSQYFAEEGEDVQSRDAAKRGASLSGEGRLIVEDIKLNAWESKTVDDDQIGGSAWKWVTDAAAAMQGQGVKVVLRNSDGAPLRGLKAGNGGGSDVVLPSGGCLWRGKFDLHGEASGEDGSMYGSAMELDLLASGLVQGHEEGVLIGGARSEKKVHGSIPRGFWRSEGDLELEYVFQDGEVFVYQGKVDAESKTFRGRWFRKAQGWDDSDAHNRGTFVFEMSPNDRPWFHEAGNAALATSLRAYLEVLYKGRLMELVLGGVRVKRRSPLSSLTDLRSYGFTFQGVEKMGRLLVTMGREKVLTIEEDVAVLAGQSTDTPGTASGFFVYHKKRLLCPFFAVADQHRGVGRGVIGVVDGDALPVIHDQDRVSLSLESWDLLEKGLEAQLHLYLRDQQGITRSISTQDLFAQNQRDGVGEMQTRPSAVEGGLALAGGGRVKAVAGSVLASPARKGQRSGGWAGREDDGEGGSDGQVEMESDDDFEVKTGDPSYGAEDGAGEAGGLFRPCGAHNGHGWHCKKPAREGSRWCEHHYRLRERQREKERAEPRVVDNKDEVLHFDPDGQPIARCAMQNGHGWRCKNPAEQGKKWCAHHLARPKSNKRKSSGGTGELGGPKSVEAEAKRLRIDASPALRVPREPSGGGAETGFASGDAVWVVGGMESIVMRGGGQTAAEGAKSDGKQVQSGEGEATSAAVSLGQITAMSVNSESQQQSGAVDTDKPKSEGGTEGDVVPMDTSGLQSAGTMQGGLGPTGAGAEKSLEQTQGGPAVTNGSAAVEAMQWSTLAEEAGTEPSGGIKVAGEEEVCTAKPAAVDEAEDEELYLQILKSRPPMSNTKLTERDAIYIFKNRPLEMRPAGQGGAVPKTGMKPIGELARMFGVAEKTVRDVWGRKSWSFATKHLWTAQEISSKAKAGVTKPLGTNKVSGTVVAFQAASEGNPGGWLVRVEGVAEPVLVPVDRLRRRGEAMSRRRLCSTCRRYHPQAQLHCDFAGTDGARPHSYGKSQRPPRNSLQGKFHSLLTRFWRALHAVVPTLVNQLKPPHDHASRADKISNMAYPSILDFREDFLSTLRLFLDKEKLRSGDDADDERAAAVLEVADEFNLIFNDTFQNEITVEDDEDEVVRVGWRVCTYKNETITQHYGTIDDVDDGRYHVLYDSEEEGWVEAAEIGDVTILIPPTAVAFHSANQPENDGDFGPYDDTEGDDADRRPYKTRSLEHRGGGEHGVVVHDGAVYRVGVEVEVLFDDRRWYRGRIVEYMRSTGEFKIYFHDDGDVQLMRLPDPDVRLPRTKAQAERRGGKVIGYYGYGGDFADMEGADTDIYQLGDMIWWQFQRGVWWPALVANLNQVRKSDVRQKLEEEGQPDEDSVLVTTFGDRNFGWVDFPEEDVVGFGLHMELLSQKITDISLDPEGKFDKALADAKRYWTQLSSEAQRDLNFRYSRNDPLAVQPSHADPHLVSDSADGWSAQHVSSSRGPGQWAGNEPGGQEYGAGWGGAVSSGSYVGQRAKNRPDKQRKVDSRLSQSRLKDFAAVEDEDDVEVELAGGWRIAQQEEADREKGKREEQLRRWNFLLSRVDISGLERRLLGIGMALKDEEAKAIADGVAAIKAVKPMPESEGAGKAISDAKASKAKQLDKILSTVALRDAQKDEVKKHGYGLSRTEEELATRVVDGQTVFVGGVTRDGERVYRGVQMSKGGKFQARITAYNQQLYLGRFDSAEEAARVYDAAARKYHGSMAIVNFPEAKTADVGDASKSLPLSAPATSSAEAMQVVSGDDEVAQPRVGSDDKPDQEEGGPGVEGGSVGGASLEKEEGKEGDATLNKLEELARVQEEAAQHETEEDPADAERRLLEAMDAFADFPMPAGDEEAADEAAGDKQNVPTDGANGGAVSGGPGAQTLADGEEGVVVGEEAERGGQETVDGVAGTVCNEEKSTDWSVESQRKEGEDERTVNESSVGPARAVTEAAPSENDKAETVADGDKQDGAVQQGGEVVVHQGGDVVMGENDMDAAKEDGVKVDGGKDVVEKNAGEKEDGGKSCTGEVDASSVEGRMGGGAEAEQQVGVADGGAGVEESGKKQADREDESASGKKPEADAKADEVEGADDGEKGDGEKSGEGRGEEEREQAAAAEEDVELSEEEVIAEMERELQRERDRRNKVENNRRQCRNRVSTLRHKLQFKTQMYGEVLRLWEREQDALDAVHDKMAVLIDSIKALSSDMPDDHDHHVATANRTQTSFQPSAADALQHSHTYAAATGAYSAGQ